MHHPIATRMGVALDSSLARSRSRSRSRSSLHIASRPTFLLVVSLALTACDNHDSAATAPDTGTTAPDGGGALPGGKTLDAAINIDAGSHLDGGSDLDGASATDASGPWNLEAAVIAIVADYDDQVRVNCPCFVTMGAYKSVAECVGFEGSGPDWVSCATPVLAAHDTPEAREIFRCYGERTRAGTKCLAMTACDANERAKCPGGSLECFAGDTAIALELAMMCPDISLLPRLK